MLFKSSIIKLSDDAPIEEAKKTICSQPDLEWKFTVWWGDIASNTAFNAGLCYCQVL